MAEKDQLALKNIGGMKFEEKLNIELIEKIIEHVNYKFSEFSKDECINCGYVGIHLKNLKLKKIDVTQIASAYYLTDEANLRVNISDKYIADLVFAKGNDDIKRILLKMLKEKQ